MSTPVATSKRRNSAVEIRLTNGRIIKVDDSIVPFYLAFSRALLVTGNHRYDARFEKWKAIFERLVDERRCGCKKERSRGRCTRAMFPFSVI